MLVTEYAIQTIRTPGTNTRENIMGLSIIAGAEKLVQDIQPIPICKLSLHKIVPCGCLILPIINSPRCLSLNMLLSSPAESHYC